MNNGSPIGGNVRPVRRSRLRLAVMLLAGVLAAAADRTGGALGGGPTVGWGSASLTYVVWVWVAVGRFSPAETRAHATVEDPSRSIIDLMILRPTSPASARWPPTSSIPMPAAAGPALAAGS